MDCPDDLADEVLALEAFADEQPEPWVIPWTPNARQQQFLDLCCREALYGGSIRGGKSGALLMGALDYVHVPGYSALILRRTYPELLGADGLIEQSHRLLDGTEARWIKSELTWVFPSGATLRFGHMQHEDDKIQYQGQAFQFIGFDELTHFTETMYTYMFSRCIVPAEGARPELAAVPLRVRAATNPGGPGHRWVKRRFGLRDDGGQNAEQARNAELNEPRPFVRATMRDNAENVNVVELARGLTNLDSTTRKQLEEGLWVEDGQGVIYKFSRKRNLIDTFDRDAGPWTYILANDLGTSQSSPTTAIVLLAYHANHNRVVVVESRPEAGLIPSTHADIIGEYEREWGLEGIIVDLGGLGAGYAGEFAIRFGELVEGAEKKNKLGFRKLLNGALERCEVQIVGWVNEDTDEIEGPNAALCAELETLPWADNGLDCAKGAADHLSDALLYGWRRCRPYASEAPAKAPAVGSPEWAAEEERRMEQAAMESALWETERPWYEGGVD